jgi:hypothetical protein
MLDLKASARRPNSDAGTLGRLLWDAIGYLAIVDEICVLD